jgi:DNA-binding response OmpR family regulator
MVLEQQPVQLRVVGGKSMRLHSSPKTTRRYPKPETPQRTILYVGSDHEPRIVLSRITRRLESVRLRVTDSGREGLLLATSLAPSLIVLDTQLRDCAVHDLLVYLVHPAHTIAPPLAVLSGNASERMRFIHGGAATCLTKPLKIAEVEQTITLLLDRSSSR